jgi:conjugative relaxase-like TrwC/TraI family protein
MITIKEQKNAHAASAYFDSHLSRDDYYSKGGKDKGQWFGKLCQELELKGTVKKETFDQLASGYDPRTGDKLTERLRKGRNAYFDFACSAPKSVSIVGIVGGDKRVVDCHQRAASKAMEYLERAACVRDRKGANVLTVKRTYTGNIAAAYFDHDSSRSLDCQLHRHFCVFNVTKGKDGKLMALDPRRMYDRSPTATEVYRNELAKGLLSIGYDLEHTKTGFEIRGVPKDLIDRFSKRKKQIAHEVSVRETKLGRKLSKKERSDIAHKTRDKKADLSEKDFHALLRGQVTSTEKQGLASLTRSAKSSKGVTVQVAEKDLIAAVLSGQPQGKRLPGHVVMRRCLAMGRGGVDLDKLETALFSRRQSNPASQDVMFRPLDRRTARMGVSLMARGHNPRMTRQLLRGLGLALRNMERAFEPAQLFK